MKKYGSGLAGQFPKAEAGKCFNRLLNRIILVCLLGGLVMGITIGLYAFPIVFKHLKWAVRVPNIAYWIVVLGTETI